MTKIVIDLDHTICTPFGGEDQSIDQDAKYRDARPIEGVIEALRKYKDAGFEIVIFTARNMRTYNGDVDLIRQNSLPIVLDWLDRYSVPFDEVIIGKPWCGEEGFYVDDRAIRPSEFKSLSIEQIRNLLAEELSS